MSNQDLEKIAAELQEQLNTLLVTATKEPVQMALNEMPKLLEREDWDLETKQQAMQLIQSSITIPFISSLVSVALGANMELRDLLYHVGDAWGQLRAKQMSQIAQEMMNRGQETSGD